MFLVNIALITSLLLPVSTTVQTQKTINQPTYGFYVEDSVNVHNNFTYYTDISKPIIENLQKEAQIKEEARIAEAKKIELELAKKAAVVKPVVKKPKQVVTTNKAVVQPKPSYSGPDYVSYIKEQCLIYGCNPDHLIRVMYCESGGTNKASKAGYIGIFQFSKSTFKANAARLGIPNADIWNPYHQIQVTAYMFARGQGGQWPSCSQKLN